MKLRNNQTSKTQNVYNGPFNLRPFSGCLGRQGNPARWRALPGKQSHLNPPGRSVHFDPRWHRWSTQWLMGFSQWRPVCPCRHAHLYVVFRSSQRRAPSGSQGFDTHPFTGEEQSSPWNPLEEFRIKGQIDVLLQYTVCVSHFCATCTFLTMFDLASWFWTYHYGLKGSKC